MDDEKRERKDQGQEQKFCWIQESIVRVSEREKWFKIKGKGNEVWKGLNDDSSCTSSLEGLKEIGSLMRRNIRRNHHFFR